MEYRYSPLYKYLAFLIILFLFLRQYKQISQDKYLIIAILITLLVILLDYMLIFDHPTILYTKDSFNTDDLDDILDDDNTVYENKNQKNNVQSRQVIRKSNKSFSDKTPSGLPTLKPMVYDDPDENDYPEYQQQNMINMHNMYNTQNSQYRSRYPSMHQNDSNEFY